MENNSSIFFFITIAILLIILLNTILSKRKLGVELIGKNRKLDKLKEADLHNQKQLEDGKKENNLLIRKNSELLQFKTTTIGFLEDVFPLKPHTERFDAADWLIDEFQLMRLQNVVAINLLEEEKYNIAIEELDLEILLQEIVVYFKQTKQEIKLELANQNVTQLKTDYWLLKHVLLNLVSNAIIYSEPSSTIVIRTESIHKNKVNIHVIDKGIGIPRKHAISIFNKYMRLGRDKARSSGAIGLGLYFSKLAVNNLGGDISLESKEGLGTDICVSLNTNF